MALNKYKLGDIIELHNRKCGIPNLSSYNVSGINKDKEFFEPSNQVGSDTSSYKVVPPCYFACNLMHVGRDVVLPIALNHTDKTKYVSPAYSVFCLKENIDVIREYFFILFKSSEMDRFFWFHTDASVRQGLSWEDFCEIEIELPPLNIQKKYVALYQAACDNLKAYESRLDSLKLVCDGYIDKLEKSTKVEKIGKCLSLCSETNIDGKYSVDDVRGISVDKTFIETKANMQGVSLLTYKLVKPREFAYVADTSRRGDKIALALNTSNSTLLVSSIYTVFRVNDVDILLSDYLAMFFHRPEFDRYARFCSWGSARETFDWDEMCNVKIPIPSIGIQRDIVNIYQCYLERKQIADQMRDKIKNLCPVLIRGSLQE